MSSLRRSLIAIFNVLTLPPAPEPTAPDKTVKPSRLTGDNPIREAKEDRLGRVAVAQSFAHQVLRLDLTEGAVVGVLGPWGSGKTSFLNLVRLELDKCAVPILHFNPWMFSGTEQLMQSFFSELAEQLELRPDLGEIGREIGEYGEIFSGAGWVPIVGPWIERARGAIKIIGKLMERRKKGVTSQRSKLQRTLVDIEKPIVVYIDDIDRLTTEEIRHIFKLVRLTASFPNIVYVLAFDRQKVEAALAEVGVSGRLYLEKILQVTLDLPAVPDHVLVRQITANVDAALSQIKNPGPFDENRWPDVFADIVRPLIRNMRDVRRYATAVSGTVEALDGQISLVDVLALEAVRVFLPDVFSKLHGATVGLTTVADLQWGARSSPEHKVQIEELIAAAQKEQREIVRKLVARLFPAGQRHIGGSSYGNDWTAVWLRDRRVAHEEILRLYLERIEGEGLQAFKHAEQAWSKLSDRAELDRYLRSLDRETLQDAIASLETYENEFRPIHVVPATIVLSNLLPELPRRARGMLDLDSRFAVGRVTYRLLKSLKDPNEVEKAIQQALPEVTTLSSKLQLITQVGHRENAGHKLVSQSAATKLEKLWRAEVRSSPPQSLAKEWDLARVLFIAKREADPSEPALQIGDSTELTLALLRASRGEVTKQSLGSRAIRRTPQLAWDVLIELFGDEATLKKRLENLRATQPIDIGDLFDLTDKYLGGWRPDPFNDE